MKKNRRNEIGQSWANNLIESKNIVRKTLTQTDSRFG